MGYDMEKIMRDRRDRHERESLEQCRTDEQRDRCGALYAAEPDLDMQVWPEHVTGLSVVKAAERYLKTGDPGKITKGLYHFATSGAGYSEVAHFDIHGFRHVYADAADFLALIEQDRRRFHNPLAVHVYTDGLTDAGVRFAIDEVATRLAASVRERSYAASRAAASEQVRELMAAHGLTLEEVAA